MPLVCSPDIQLFCITTANQGETMLVHTRELDSEKLCHLLNAAIFIFVIRTISVIRTPTNFL